ncbi:MAG: pyridoxal-phosphate dependent enzyme [Pseudomonadota bacterium]
MLLGYNYLPEIAPQLARRTSRIGLGTFPTPVREHGIDGFEIRVKHDELSSPDYAGNKLRKLEYLLAKARGLGAENIATFGAAGSNHAYATALHARRNGLKPIAFLGPQSKTANIAQMLNHHRRLGTRLIWWHGNRAERSRIIKSTMRSLQGRSFVIPMGGTNLYGSLGFVAAAAELSCQIRDGLCPKPERIYLPMGTMGSVAGLAVGLSLANIDTTIVAVRVVNTSVAGPDRLFRLCDRLTALCQHLGAGPISTNWRQKIELRNEQLGKGYAYATPAANEAKQLAADSLGLMLETTYSAKALAALLADLRSNTLASGDGLFWNTYSGPANAPLRINRTPAALPSELKGYASSST